MRKFEVGDVVVVNKPEDVNQFPHWIDDMDRFDGAIMTVSHVSGGIFETAEAGEIDFHHSWAKPAIDPINHPAHYAGSNGIECIDAMRATLTPDEFRGYCKGAAFKYIWRERQKGGNESLAKAVWYLNEAQK